MHLSVLLLVLLVLTSAFYILGRRRAFAVSGGNAKVLHSLPGHYGMMVALWCGIPAVILLLAWLALENTIITQMVAASLPTETPQSAA